MIKQEQLDLIEFYLDDALGEDGLREVRRLMAESPEFRRELVWARRLRGRGAVAGTVTVESLPGKVMERINEFPAVMWPGASAAETHAGRWGWMRWAAVAALFAVLASLTGAHLWMRGNLGELRTCKGDIAIMRGGREIAPTPGAAFRIGDQIRAGRGGSALVAYRDGTMLKVFSQSQLVLGSLHGAKRIRLESGTIHMDVAKQPDGRPLEVTTEQSRCTVCGTTFDVTAVGNSTRLDVQKGAVEMRAADAPEKPVMVTAGQRAVTNGVSAPVVHAVTDPVFRSVSVSRVGLPTGRVPVSVAIFGARKLYLVVLQDNADNVANNAVWINPRVVGSAGVLDLTKFPWTRAREGWQQAPVPTLNIGQCGWPLVVKGRKVSGIATHATSVIEYDLPPGCDRFEAEGALYDLGSPSPGDEYIGRVVFEVYTKLSPAKLESLRNCEQAP